MAVRRIYHTRGVEPAATGNAFATSVFPKRTGMKPCGN
jgi:hypothetical protein